MAELHVPMTNYGATGHDALARVEIGDGDGSVALGLDWDPPSTGCEWRTLTPDEARALAAALVHMAAEAER